MRSRRRPSVYLVALAAVAAVALLLATSGGGSRRALVERPSVAGWRGLVGDPRSQVALGQRVIVVLSAPSLGDRVAAAGGRASDVDERRWTVAAFAAQQQLISKLGTQGIRVDPEYRFVRVLNGFSAALDAQGVAVLQRMPGVAAIYPVRAVYPATTSAVPDWGAWSRPASSLGGFDGRGVTIALLDTGVDRGHPFLRGHVLPGYDVAGDAPDASARANPADPGDVERHGTEMAGILVGARGPGGLSGIAPGATVLPIRVGGWQRDATGRWSIFARTDQVLAGLERAADPNQDGDAHDAVRLALVPLAEPFGAFADSPLARAAAGALQLDMLVVAPAGNDGPAGPAFGSLSGPGGAPAALTVGAADLRPATQSVRVVVRTGLDVRFAGSTVLAGAVAPRSPLDLQLAAARGPDLASFFDRRGYSLVAGRAALVPAGDDPAATIASAVRAGARAVVVYGGSVPAGGLGLDERTPVPVVGVPASLAADVLAALRRGGTAAVSLGASRLAPSESHGRVAAFSSRGLAFDGRVKPEVVAAGVGVATAEPGRADDGSPRYGTVNGSSAAAAVVAGVGALLLQARPSLDAATLKGLLVGSAHPLARDGIAAQGAGLVDAGAAVATEFAAVPATLPFGRGTTAGWRAHRVLLLRNVSSRPLRLFVSSGTTPRGDVGVTVPARVDLPAGATQRLVLTIRVRRVPAGDGTAVGTITLTPIGGRALRVPWSVAVGPGPEHLIRSARLSRSVFRPSDVQPVVLSFEAGRVGTGDALAPVARLDVELWTGGGRNRVGVLATLRDVLPGRYAIGLTGRGPDGAVLARGRWQLRIVAQPTSGGAPSVVALPFTIRE